MFESQSTVHQAHKLHIKVIEIKHAACTQL